MESRSPRPLVFNGLSIRGCISREDKLLNLKDPSKIDVQVWKLKGKSLIVKSVHLLNRVSRCSRLFVKYTRGGRTDYL